MAPVIQRGGWDYAKRIRASEIPWTGDAPYWLLFHDRDLAMDPGSIARLLADLGSEVRYVSANEYCAYLHARVERDLEARGGLAVTVHYDDHYCRYFATHPSTWMLHLSDETRRALKTSVPEKRALMIPAGLGRRLLTAEAGPTP
jgi:hypothetical protein